MQLPQPQPVHGAKLSWRDKVRQDLKRFGIVEADWHHLAKDQNVSRDVCQEGLQKVQNTALSAQFICHCEFQRRQDIVRHMYHTTCPRVANNGKHHSVDGFTLMDFNGKCSMVSACVCLCVCVCARACVCVRACVYVCDGSGTLYLGLLLFS